MKCGKAVQEDEIAAEVSGPFAELHIDLVGTEPAHPFRLFRFFAHRNPDIGVEAVCPANGGFRIGFDRNGGTVLLCDFDGMPDIVRVGQKLCRGTVDEIDTGFGATEHERRCDIVPAVADIDDFASVQILSEVLAESHEIREDLCRVVIVGQAIPNGNAGESCELFHGILAEAAEEDAIEEATEHASGVFDAFLVSEVDIVLIQIFGVSALVLSGDEAGIPGSGRALFENEGDIAPVQEITADAGVFTCLERLGQLQELNHLFIGEIVQGAQVAFCKSGIPGNHIEYLNRIVFFVIVIVLQMLSKAPIAGNGYSGGFLV